MQPLRHAGTSLHKEVRALDKQYKAYHKEYKHKGKWGIVNDFFHGFLLFSFKASVSRNPAIVSMDSLKKDSCISISCLCRLLHRRLINIHESHYLRFARLYSQLIIRMLTNHTFALTTPSWTVQLLDKFYQYSGVCQQRNPKETLPITENHCVNITSKTVPPDGFDRTVMLPSCTLTIS